MQLKIMRINKIKLIDNYANNLNHFHIASQLYSPRSPA
jgi:hypothetical protein